MKTKITKIFNRAGYEQTIKFLMESKTIFFMDCNCPDFEFRRIKKSGSFSDIKYFADCCKHLKPFIDFYEKQGFTLKKPKPMSGTDRCTSKLLKNLIDRSIGLCENNCGKNGVNVHRKIRGSNGGKYNEENCVLLCSECHKLAHGNEFPGSKGK